MKAINNDVIIRPGAPPVGLCGGQFDAAGIPSQVTETLPLHFGHVTIPIVSRREPFSDVEKGATRMTTLTYLPLTRSVGDQTNG